MGCCQSSKANSTFSPLRKGEIQRAPTSVQDVTSAGELFERLKQVGTFKFKVTGLITLHNHICLAREKKDAHSLLVFDVSQSNFAEVHPSSSHVHVTDIWLQDSPIGLYRCRSLDMVKVISTKESVEEFQKMIYFKHVFLVGLD